MDKEKWERFKSKSGEKLENKIRDTDYREIKDE